MNNMEIVVALVIVALILSGSITLGSLFFKKNTASDNRKKINRKKIIDETNKKLLRNPHDGQALTTLSNIYFEEEKWAKAYPLFELMASIASAVPEIDPTKSYLRLGICALKQKAYTEALKAFLLARKNLQENFEINFYIGQSLYYIKEYEKSITAFKKALIFEPQHPEANLFMGNALYKNSSYRNAVPVLKKALDLQPENKEILFNLAKCLMETGNASQALKIFLHLRPHPEFGTHASLNAALINMHKGAFEEAIKDLTIGLKHPDSESEIAIQLYYNLGLCYLKIKNISKAVGALKKVNGMNPSYKDTATLLKHYQELNQNANLQVFLIANNTDFISLCRRFVVQYYPKAKVAVTNVTVTTGYTEILTDINTSKWQDDVLFRFYRSNTVIGELYIRDFHAKIKDTKVGRGVCVCAGSFSSEANSYADCRPIELVDKVKLNVLLAKI